MDVLELLKKNWKSEEGIYPSLSASEIYPMLWKRSSSLVKWIFYVSLLELFVGLASVVYVVFDKNYREQLNDLDMAVFGLCFDVLAFGLLTYFMICFYRNYRRISLTDDIKMLMENILRARRTVKNYIRLGLSLVAVYVTVVMIVFIRKSPQLPEIMEKSPMGGSETLFWVITVAVVLGVVAVIVTFIWLVYQLFYGILLRKLRSSYRELSRVEL